MRPGRGGAGGLLVKWKLSKRGDGNVSHLDEYLSCFFLVYKEFHESKKKLDEKYKSQDILTNLKKVVSIF